MDLPIWYKNEMEEAEKRKFNVNDIKAYIHKIFSMYERSTSKTHHIVAEDFRDMIADNVYIEFPDCTIKNWEDFKQWHANIHSALVNDLHVVDNIEISFLADGRYQADFVVRWYAHYKNGDYVDQRIEQVWTIREEETKDCPILECNIAKIADFR